MYFLYSALLTLGFVLLLPRFALDALRSGKYVTGLRQRLGKIPQINSNGKRVVWLHCVSVGEAQAAQSLVRAISERYPNLAPGHFDNHRNRAENRPRNLPRPRGRRFLIFR